MKKVLYAGTVLLSLGTLWTVGIDNGYASSFDNELIVAVENNQAAEVYKNIRKGRSVNKRGKYQNTALIRAAAAGYVDIGKILIENGANINLQNISGASALHRAAAGGYTDFVALLLEKKANVNIRDGEGWTPLMTAIARKRADVANMLIKNGADTEVASFFGETALHIAVKVRSEEMVNVLLNAGADYMSKNSKGQTVYEIAEEKSPDLAVIITSYSNKKLDENTATGKLVENNDVPKSYDEFINNVQKDEEAQLNTLSEAENAFREATEKIKTAKIMAEIKNVEAQLKIEKAREDLSKIRLRRELAEQAMLKRKTAKEKRIEIENQARDDAEKKLREIERKRKVFEARKILMDEDARIRSIHQAKMEKIKRSSELKLAERKELENRNQKYKVALRKEIETEMKKLLKEELDKKIKEISEGVESKKAQEVAEIKGLLKKEFEKKVKEISENTENRTAKNITSLRKKIEVEVRQVLNSEFSKKVQKFEKKQEIANANLAKMEKAINVKIEEANKMVTKKNEELEKLKEYAVALEIQQVKLVRRIKKFLQSERKSTDPSIDSGTDDGRGLGEQPEIEEKTNDSAENDNINLSNNILAKNDAEILKLIESEDSIPAKPAPEVSTEIITSKTKVEEKAGDITVSDIDRISKIEREIKALEVTRQAKIMESDIMNKNPSIPQKESISKTESILLSENEIPKRKRRTPLGNKKIIELKESANDKKTIFVPKVSGKGVVSKNWWESDKSSVVPKDKTDKKSIEVEDSDMQAEKMTVKEIDETREGAIERLKKAKDDMISDEEIDKITEIDENIDAFEVDNDATKEENKIKEEKIEDKSIEDKPEENIKQIDDKMNQVDNKVRKNKVTKFDRIAALKRLRAARDKIAKTGNNKRSNTLSSSLLFNNEIKEIASINDINKTKREKVISAARERAHSIINKNKKDARKTVGITLQNKKRQTFLANLEKKLSQQEKIKTASNSKNASGGRNIADLPWIESNEKDAISLKQDIEQGSIKITKVHPIDRDFTINSTADKNRKNIEKIARIIASIKKSDSIDNDKTAKQRLSKGSIANDGNIAQDNKGINKPYFVKKNGEYKLKFPRKEASIKRLDSGLYWLKIGDFVDSRTAYQHYRNVTSEHILKGLQYRPVYSAKPGMSNVSFKVGPLKSIKEASKLCMKFRGGNLGCSTIATAR